MRTIINPEYEEPNLSQIEQSVNVGFSYAKTLDNGEVKRYHEWVKCRDFLGDVIWSNKYKRPISIYRFNGSYDRIPLEDGHFELLLKFPSALVKRYFLSNYKNILHNLEFNNEIPLTTVEDGVDKNIVLLKCPEFWRESIPAISFYTFIIKVCCYKYENPVQWMDVLRGMNRSTEGQYVRGLGLNLPKLLKNVRKYIGNPVNLTGFSGEEARSTHVIHNSCGFYSRFQMPDTNNTFSTRFFGEQA